MKAVIFCHFHHKSAEYKPEQRLGAQEVDEITKSVLSYYKAYLKCKNIGLIYVYVDTGTRQILHNIFRGDEKINIDINELAFEHTVRNILKLAAHQALKELSKDKTFDPAAAPKFQFIGLPHLASLIASLYRMDRDLVENLAGRDRDRDNFTYDAPKFVEAVIRLARDSDNEYPILRFDQDVEVNEDALDILLAKIKNSDIRGYSFFSGGYGRSGISDPVNDYAVRCHWLANTRKYPNKPPYHLVQNGEHFLRDIGEFGATSLPNSKKVSTSVAMKNYLAELPEGNRSTNRDNEQVISGAGLYMSNRAILRLPPFMNLKNNIVWVDDHLKRRLHEVLGDLARTQLEHVDESLFHQERYPDGIEKDNILWAQDTYFYRLISGCIMHALIVTRRGERGELAKFVANFLLTHHRTRDDEFIELATKFMDVAQKTAVDLLEIWSKADYGNDTLQEWALENHKELQRGNGKLGEWINSTVQDAIHYCKLVENWDAYVFAIQALVPHDAYWLFRSID